MSVFYSVISVFAVVSAALLTVMSLKLLQILQLSSYRARGVTDWFKSTKLDYPIRYFAAMFFSVVPMIVYVACFGKYEYIEYIGLVFYLINTVMFIAITARQKNKTPLKFTHRVIRLVILSAILFAGASFGLLFAGQYLYVKYSILGLMPVLIPFVTLLAHYILLPFESLNNRRYVVKAKRKLNDMPNLIKIGITGSYGKTTAKNMLAAMLGKKYNVLITPSSYNTPMGIAKTVNNSLNGSHNVFIAEMGARYKGDIAELAKIVKPTYAAVTAVGNQHLSTFKSIENIYETKYELVKSLPHDGIAAFSADNEYTLKMFGAAECGKILAGKSDSGNAEVKYSDVSFGANGTSFKLMCGDDSVEITTRLLGRHVPSLISLCAALALKLGVTLAEIAESVSLLQPVEHRLQLIQNGDVTVLDDAYNSNTEGSAIALEVLGAFEGTRIVITPGLVELGEAETEANEHLGRNAAKYADYAYFVGARGEVLKSGAIAGGMSEDKITLCASLSEAVEKSGAIAGRKTILFENDLPDNY